MNFKFDPGDCSCCDATPCCATVTTDCGSSYDPEDRCCCVCAEAPPCEVDVTISGIVTETEGCGGNPLNRRALADCENCSNYNGTYSLQRFWSNQSTPPSGQCEWWGFFNCEFDEDDWPRCVSCSTDHIIHDQINMIQLLINAGEIRVRVWTTLSAYLYIPNSVNWCSTVFYDINQYRLNHFFSSAALTYIGSPDEVDDDTYDCDFDNISLSPDPEFPWHEGTNLCDWSGVTISVSAG